MDKTTLLLKASAVKKQEIERLKKEYLDFKKRGSSLTLKVILVGKHPPSVVYTGRKKIFIESLGGQCEIIDLPEDVSAATFTDTVKNIAGEKNVHGLFVQLPLPSQLSSLSVGSLILREKDVDGFHAENLELLLRGDIGKKALIPCTPKGIVALLEHYNHSLKGKQMAILGRSMIVGKPMALLALNYQATPTICHSQTSDVRAICRRSDIIVSAVGIPRFLDDSYIGKNFPVVVDVGINRDDEGNIRGDVDFEKVAPLCSSITPVPGGVGPMTILSLAQNLLQAAQIQRNLE